MYEDITSDKGLIFNVQRFALHDGPGIRTTVFLKGCPLHCLWCSNPESISPSPELITRDAKCILCGRCLDECPQQVITIVENERTIDWARCNSCMKCADVCPSRAIERVGDYMTIDEVTNTVVRDSSYYRRTNGGMTLSGGEPLVQWQFAVALLRDAKRMGLHTAVDTTGHAEWDVFAEVLRYTDLVLYDVKHIDARRHEEATGVSNDRILDNLQKTLADSNVVVWVRIPIIPRFNDSEEAIANICAFVRTLPHPVEKVSLLPFHKFGGVKYPALGKAYNWEDIPLINEYQMEAFKKLVESYGFSADIGR
jgi:pyruvate formate lyase activating enzyme